MTDSSACSWMWKKIFLPKAKMGKRGPYRKYLQDSTKKIPYSTMSGWRKKRKQIARLYQQFIAARATTDNRQREPILGLEEIEELVESHSELNLFNLCEAAKEWKV